MDLNLSMERRKEITGNIIAAQNEYHEIVLKYEAIIAGNATNDTNALWKQIKEKSNQWLAEGEKYAAIQQSITSSFLGNPSALKSEMFDIKGRHTTAGFKAMEAMFNGKANDSLYVDPLTCRFGTWLKNFEELEAAQNHQLREKIEAIKPSHIAFHNNIAELADAIKAGGKGKDELQIYQNRISKAVDGMLKSFDDIIAEADKVEAQLIEAQKVLDNILVLKDALGEDLSKLITVDNAAAQTAM